MLVGAVMVLSAVLYKPRSRPPSGAFYSGDTRTVCRELYPGHLKSGSDFPLLIQSDSSLAAAALRPRNSRLGNMRLLRQLLGGPPETRASVPDLGSREHQNASPLMFVFRKWLNAVPIHKAKKPEKPVREHIDVFLAASIVAVMQSDRTIRRDLNGDADRHLCLFRQR